MKKIIIDGHNLIPKIPGLHLKDMDDEARLIELIREYCRLARRQAELFFDGSPEPNNSGRKNGLVNIHFIRIGSSADDAIISLLRSHTKDKDHLTLVSSDHRIQGEARTIGCEILSSETFAQQVMTMLNSGPAVQQKKEKPLSPAEVDDWMDFFNKEKNS